MHVTPAVTGITAVSSDRPIRVLLTAPPMTGHGGVSQYFRVLRPYLRDDVQYLTIGSRSDKESVETTFLRIVQDSCRFARTLTQGNFDIVHLNPSILPKALLRDGILLLFAKALGKEVLVFAHGWNPAWDSGFPKYLHCAFRVVYGQADAFVVLGNRFKEKLRSLGYDKSVFVEGAPVADELLDGGEDEGTHRCTAPDHLFNILFLARVERDKGIYEALDTYHVLKRENQSVSMTVAGDGSELSAARRYALSRQLDDVSFVGHVEGAEKRRVFKRANAYLFPSHHEGLPLSVLEAMAFGLPIVTSDVGSLRDFFKDGTMGYMSENRDPDVLALLLNRLIYNPSLCSEIRNFNRNYATTNFEAHQIAIRIETIYRRLLGVGRNTIAAE